MSLPFDRVLVPLDLSATADRAISVARGLAEALDVPLELLAVSSPFSDESADRRVLEQRRLDGGPRSSVRVVRDSDVIAVIVGTGREAHTLTCMSTHGRGVLGRSVIGSVARDVLAASHRPAVLVGPAVDVATFGPPRSILLGTDGFLEVREGDAIVRLARGLRVAVHVVAVEETPGVVAPGSVVTGLSLVDHVDGLCAQLGRLGVEAVPRVIRQDHAARGLCAVLAMLLSPLAVLASRTSGTAGALGLGSVSDYVVRDGAAPVLVVPRHIGPE